MRKIISALASVLLVAFASLTPVQAAIIDLTPVDQGHFKRKTITGAAPSDQITHDSEVTAVEILDSRIDAGLFRTTSYSVGYLIFWIPDLGGKTVTSATLHLDWTGSAFSYWVNDFGLDPALLLADYGPQTNPTSVMLANDLRNGPRYASSMTPGLDSLLLNASALSAIEAKSEDIFVVGLSGGHTVLFDSAILVSSSLHLQTVPEPSSLSMVALVAVAVVRRRSR